MVRTTIGRAVRAARKDGDDVHPTLADRIGSDDCAAAVHTSRVLMNNIAERVALDGDLLPFLTSSFNFTRSSTKPPVTLGISSSLLPRNTFRSFAVWNRNRHGRFTRLPGDEWLCPD